MEGENERISRPNSLLRVIMEVFSVAANVPQ